MPTMPRIPSKATKIAYKVLGIPANLKNKKTVEQRRVNQRLTFEETARVR
jgi:hypothetical protein